MNKVLLKLTSSEDMRYLRIMANSESLWIEMTYPAFGDMPFGRIMTFVLTRDDAVALADVLATCSWVMAANYPKD